MTMPFSGARQLSEEVLEALHLRALHGFELVYTESDVAERLGVRRETVPRGWSGSTARGVSGQVFLITDPICELLAEMAGASIQVPCTKGEHSGRPRTGGDQA